MPSLVIKMMVSYLMTAEQTTPSVRERIGNYAPLYVSYDAELYEPTWMQRQLERAKRLFHCQIDSQAISERFNERLLQQLNTLYFFISLSFLDSRPDLKRITQILITLRNTFESSFILE